MSRSSSFAFLLGVWIVLACLAGDSGDARTELTRAMSVTLRLIDAPQPLAGDLVAWSEQAVWIRSKGSGSQAEDVAERQVDWREIQPSMAFDVARKLIDAKSSKQWVWLGLTMLEARDEGLGKRAFDVAARLEPELRPRIESALRAFKSGGDPAEAFAPAPPEAPDGSKVPGSAVAPEATPARRGVLPGQGGAAVRPWPRLSAQQQAEHVRQVREACDGFLSKAGLKLEPVETERFLFYSELSKPETLRWAAELDKMYATLITTLEIPEGTELFQGKCAVFVFRERQMFLDFSKKVFNNDATKFSGFNHQRQGYTFTVFYKQAHDMDFNTLLIHETVHAFMYRYRTPMGLPTWANEGLADYVAGHLVPYSTTPLRNWQHARNFAAQRKRVLDIMKQSYVDQSWPTDDSYPVSHMLVRFMLKNKPREFKLWIDDVKSGTDWQVALRERFGVTPETLAEGFGADILRESGYSRLR